VKVQEQPAERALDGLRVVDFGQYIAGPLAAMLLADNGAEVIRIDPPGGPRWDHPANAILQRGKKSIVLDLKRDADHDVARRLVTDADVVVENFRPGVMRRLGLGPEAMTVENPRLVYCSLPGFSRRDPRAGLAAWEGILGAATGHYTPGVALSWGNDAPTEPSFSALPMASVFGAIVAVNSVLAALIARHRGGVGQIVEVPLFAAMFECIGISGQKLPVPQSKFGHVACAIEAACADGRWAYLVMATRRQYRKFAAAFFPEGWAEEGLADPIALENDPDLAEEARRRIVELLATKPAVEWDRLINEAGVPFSPCQTTKEWLADEDARDVRAVIELDDPIVGPTRQLGYPISLSATPPGARSPRARLDADRDEILAVLARREERPRAPIAGASAELGNALEGIRVIDLTLVLAGPTAGRVLAEFGADVIKINQPNYWVVGHLQTNSGKRNALIDLTTDEGRQILAPLAERCDVFIQNCTYGTAGRMGVGEADIRTRREDVVYCSISTYNYDGRRASFRGYEPLGQAPTGIMLRWGGGTPRLYRFTACDYATGHLGAMACLVGLYHRLVRGGDGQHVQASLVQAGSLHQLPFMVAYEGAQWDEPAGPDAKGFGPLDRLYRAADGWFYLAAVRPGEAELVRMLTGVPAVDERSLAEVFARDRLAVWLGLFEEAGVAAHELVDIEALMEDPEVKQQGLSIVRDHPGVGPVRMPGPTPRLSRTPVKVTRPAAPPGADTPSVVADAGLADRLGALAGAGVVAEGLPDDEIVVY
jgi:crotonobetainyl-CoA:carnitine CoA-transferase CaiB-like acyl-CoA transferase